MILNKHLVNVAKAMSGDSYTYPAYFSVSSDVVSVDADDTVLPGEIDTRFLSSATSTDNAVIYSGLRSGTEVTVSGGDAINTFGAFSQVTSGDMHIEVTLPTITQTTNFDIEFNVTLQYNRQ
jgi:hypothetical protein